MNWDYKHSLSIQIERQRCNISCGLRRWKWFIFKDVAASFHYFKVLFISVVLEPTNSHVQEEQAHGGCDFFPACQWTSYHEDLLPVSFRALSFLHGRLHGTGRVTCLPEELWFLTFLYFPRPAQRVYNPSPLPPIPRQSTFLAILIFTGPPWQLTLHLTSFFTDTCWNEEQPLAPWTNVTLPFSSPWRAVIGKHLKHCDHLQ